MKKTRTQLFLSSRSPARGFDGEHLLPADVLQDPTFVPRLSFKIVGPDRGLRASLAAVLANGLEEKPLIFLDANIWSVNTEVELWQALARFREDVIVIPQVKAELGSWLSSHLDHPATHAILSAERVLSIMDLPTPYTSEWDAYAYYVSLLGLRRRVLELGEMVLIEREGRSPSPGELRIEVQKIFGERGLLLGYKGGTVIEKPSSWLMSTDESLVYLAACAALTSGRPTIILTKDQDVLEQFYKLWWFLDTHYRAMLLADEYIHSPFVYPISTFPKLAEAERYFYSENAILVQRGAARMSAILPKTFSFVSVECWHLGAGVTRFIFGAEREMQRLLEIKGETGGLVSAKLGGGRNLHPWLVPLPLGERIVDSIALVRDRSVPIMGAGARIGVFDATHAVNTRERFSVIVPDDTRATGSILWTPKPRL
jgi:hypothetical protein